MVLTSTNVLKKSLFFSVNHLIKENKFVIFQDQPVKKIEVTFFDLSLMNSNYAFKGKICKPQAKLSYKHSLLFCPVQCVKLKKYEAITNSNKSL